MSKKQLIIEARSEDAFDVSRGMLSISSEGEEESAGELWVRPGEELEIVLVSKSSGGVSLWIEPLNPTDPPALSRKEYVEAGRVDIEGQTRTVRVSRSPLAPSEERRYGVQATKRGVRPVRDDGPIEWEGAAGTLNSSPK